MVLNVIILSLYTEHLLVYLLLLKSEAYVYTLNRFFTRRVDIGKGHLKMCLASILFMVI